MALVSLPVVLGSPWNSALHGGVLRSLQLKAWFARAGYELVPVNWTDIDLHAGDLCKSVSTAIKIGGTCRSGRGYATALLRSGNFRRQLRASEARSDVLILECTSHAFIVEAALSEGYRVLAFPQNIESLNDTSCHEYHAKGGLPGAAREISYLGSRCAGVWAISSEDAWLFGQVSAHVHWLPYIPPDYIQTRCAVVRERRALSSRDHVLIMNTRQATADEGVRRLMETLEEQSIRTVVCGRGTEHYLTWRRWKNVTVIGTVNDEQLIDLWARSRCAVIYGRKGSGALTRIPELLLAGVPVVCNVAAARSAWLWQGIVLADGMRELPEACERADVMQTSTVPPEPLIRLVNQGMRKLRATIAQKDS